MQFAINKYIISIFHESLNNTIFAFRNNLAYLPVKKFKSKSGRIAQRLSAPPYIDMDNELLYCVLRIRLLALILPFIYPFFCLLGLNLCHSFLWNYAS